LIGFGFTTTISVYLPVKINQHFQVALKTLIVDEFIYEFRIVVFLSWYPLIVR